MAASSLAASPTYYIRDNTGYVTGSDGNTDFYTPRSGSSWRPAAATSNSLPSYTSSRTYYKKPASRRTYASSQPLVYRRTRKPKRTYTYYYSKPCNTIPFTYQSPQVKPATTYTAPQPPRSRPRPLSRPRTRSRPVQRGPYYPRREMQPAVYYPEGYITASGQEPPVNSLSVYQQNPSPSPVAVNIREPELDQNQNQPTVLDFSSGSAVETESGLNDVEMISEAEANALAAKDFSVLLETVKRVKLDEELKRQGAGMSGITIFAPTNEAFAAAFPDGGLNNLPPSVAKKIVLRHVVLGSMPTSMIKSGTVSLVFV